MVGNIEKFNKKYHISLNSQQCAAQASIDGRYLILAVPGSGKTTVLVDRLGYMVVEGGIDPKSILTVTFTRAAAGEMQKRFAAQFDDDAHHYSNGINFCTINSLAFQILKHYGDQIGKKQYDVISDDDLHKVIRDVFLRNEKEYATESDYKNMCTGIAYVKNMMLQKEEIDKQTEVYKTFPQMYAEYNYIIHSRKLMDYDDQLIYAYKLLESNEELLNYYRSIYRYISVDEAQDTSYIQHCLIQLLVGETGNLFMVGDEDQSIYGFRAAYPQELYEFQNIYDDAQILNIETNYRSGSVIVQLADGFIQKNKQRHPKRMTPDRKDVGDIEDIDFHSRREVAQYLSTIAKEKPVDTAILYRNNESALPIVNLLDKQGIPYRIRGNDTTFFSHPVIRDISAILQLSLNGRNREAFRQIYYKVSAYITKGEAQEATSTYISDNDFFAYLAVNGKEGTKKTKRLWFVSYRLREMREMSALDAIRMIRDKLSYDNYMREKGLDYKKADMYEILASQCGNVGDFLKRMEELETIVSEGSNSDEGIHLSTIHMSKGLEYDTVYLLDSLQGIFPAVTADIQEERRLFYVAVTRAKNHLKFLSVYDGDDQPSSFVTEALGLAPFTRSKVKL